jgi:hypothetical protein
MSSMGFLEMNVCTKYYLGRVKLVLQQWYRSVA